MINRFEIINLYFGVNASDRWIAIFIFLAREARNTKEPNQILRFIIFQRLEGNSIVFQGLYSLGV